MRSIPKITNVDFFLTYNCNCKCSYCFVQDSGSDITMPSHILDKSIEWIARHAGYTVELFFLGGEPTLKPDLIERAVHKCKKAEKHYPVSFSYKMTTNGLNIDEKMAEKLANWKVHYLLSIDGYRERHNKSRPARFTDDPFEIIQSRFSLLKKYQQNITARMTVLPSLVKGLSTDLTKLQQMGFNAFIVSPATGVRWSEKKIQLYIDEMALFAAGRSIKEDRPFPYISPIDDPIQGNNSWGCRAGRGRLSIDPRGKIFACTRMTRLNDEEGLSFGDIYSGINLDGNINIFQDRTYSSRFECIDCSLREKCIGGCPAVNWDTNKSVVKPAQDECRMMYAFEEIKQRVSRQRFIIK